MFFLARGCFIIFARTCVLPFCKELCIAFLQELCFLFFKGMFFLSKGLCFFFSSGCVFFFFAMFFFSCKGLCFFFARGCFFFLLQGVLRIEPEALRKLMKEALGDKVEEVNVSNRMVDSLRVLTMSEHSLPDHESRGGGSRDPTVAVRQESLV